MEAKYILIGGGVLGVVAFLFWPRAAVTKTESNGVSPSPQPLFLSGSGGSTMPANAPAYGEPLGGYDWQPPTPDINNDPSVEIARVNAAVQQANIAAQKEVALLMLQPPVTTGSGGVTTVPKPTMAQASSYISAVAADTITQQEAFQIYDKAVQYGYSAVEVAQAAARAGIDLTVSQIDSFISSNNLKPL